MTTPMPASPFLDPGASPPSAHSAVTPQMGDGRISIQSSDWAAESFREVQAEMGRERAKSPPTAVEPVASPSEAFRTPAGYVLVERELLGRVVRRLWQQSERDREELLLPAFLHERPLRDIADAMMTPRNRTR